jgi:hypothetical protein
MNLINHNNLHGEETFAEFVINNKESILKRCTNTFLKSTNSISGSKVEKITRYNVDLIRKWGSAISINSLSTDFTETLCFFCEVLSLYDERCKMSMSYNIINIDNELKLVYERISKYKHRSKIVDKYYNYHTGKTEYLLEDGSFVPTEGVPATINIDYRYFPTEFLPLLNESEYRNAKIDQIL